MEYKFNLAQQIIIGTFSSLTVVVITQIFDNEINWAMAIAVGIGIFFYFRILQKNLTNN